MQSQNREVVIVLGKTGYGKSTWLTQYCQVFSRRFVFDPFMKFPAQYLSEETLLAAHENGEYAAEKNASFSVGTMHLATLDLLGAISFLSKNCVFIIEECGVAFFKGERIPDWLSEIIFLGRHHNVSLVLTAQRAASIPIELRSQANRFVTFRQTEKNDVRWCSDYIGERVEELPNLAKFYCLDADNDSVTSYQVSPSATSAPSLRPAAA